MPLPAAEWRAEVEFERRLVHFGGTLYPAPFLLGWLTWTETRYFLVVALAVVCFLEFLRLVVGLDHAVYRHLTREYESDSVAGYALYQVSMTGVVLLLQPTLAIPAMWMLSVGDPVSGALGDNDATESKRPVAWIAMFLVSFALALPFTVPAFGGGAGVASRSLARSPPRLPTGSRRSSAALPSTTTSPSHPSRPEGCSSRPRCWRRGRVTAPHRFPSASSKTRCARSYPSFRSTIGWW
ncbi:dolichol kinase [Halorubrum saccharovorum]|uniref:Dolichol kinase n=1 Tax=Halorubrum saccharovorum TaxID=2248 RepID=A0A0F8AV45_9EURY|nr:dolichol kinase [Halorubrum saccharovorum]KKF39576.1 dolichol kinase [Halorubrum saccharovorum]